MSKSILPQKTINTIPVAFSDTTTPKLQMRATKPGVAVVFDADGSATSSKLEVTVTENDDATTSFSMDATGDGDTHVHLATDTIDGLVTAMNANLTDMKVRRYNSAGTLSVATDDFIDGTVQVPEGAWVNGLYEDVSEIRTAAYAVASPETGQRGRVAISQVRLTATYASGAVTWVLYEDEHGGTAKQLLAGTCAATTVASNVIDQLSAPLTFRGPLRLQVTGSAALSALSGHILFSHVEA
jgi:hypothetical protein